MSFDITGGKAGQIRVLNEQGEWEWQDPLPPIRIDHTGDQLVALTEQIVQLEKRVAVLEKQHGNPV